MTRYSDAADGVWGELAPVRVNRLRCLSVRNRNVACSACADACPSSCIEVADGAVSVAFDACCGCGACATVCPTGVFEPRLPTDAGLFERCAKALVSHAGEACLVCRDALRANGAAGAEAGCAVEVPCLGRVDESLLLTLAALGVERCVLVHGACGACSCPGGVEAAHTAVSNANALAVALNSGFVAEIAGVLPGFARGDDPGGAEGARVAAEGGSTRVAAAADASPAPGGSTVEAGPLPKLGRAGVFERHVPDRRKRLLKALAVLARGVDEGALAQPVPMGLWGRVEVDYDRCRTCRACAMFCPTGALEKFTARDDSAMGVVNTATLCVMCGCCEAVCPADALRVAPALTFDELLGARRERIDMPPRPRAKDQGELMFNRMKNLLGGTYMYLR